MNNIIFATAIKAALTSTNHHLEENGSMNKQTLSVCAIVRRRFYGLFRFVVNL